MRIFDGIQWENFTKRLLAIKYRDDNFQEIPSYFGGDYGLEGYTLKTGLSFQCYKPDHNLTIKEQYEHQRDKITTDLGKLKKYKKELKEIFGNDLKLKEWHLITTEYKNKLLLRHCRKKEKEILKYDLDFIDENFKVVIKTINDFIPEIKTYFATTKEIIRISKSSIEPEIIQKFIEEEEIVNTLKDKYSNIYSEPEELNLQMKNAIEDYLIGKEYLNKLEAFSEELESFFEQKSIKEREIERFGNSEGLKNMTYFHNTLKDFNKMVRENFKLNFDKSTINYLTQYSVVEWLLKCSLKFN